MWVHNSVCCSFCSMCCGIDGLQLLNSCTPVDLVTRQCAESSFSERVAGMQPWVVSKPPMWAASSQCPVALLARCRCTAVTAVVVGDRLLVANVGDSRAVLSREGKGAARSSCLVWPHPQLVGRAWMRPMLTDAAEPGHKKLRPACWLRSSVNCRKDASCRGCIALCSLFATQHPTHSESVCVGGGGEGAGVGRPAAKAQQLSAQHHLFQGCYAVLLQLTLCLSTTSPTRGRSARVLRTLGVLWCGRARGVLGACWRCLVLLETGRSSVTSYPRLTSVRRFCQRPTIASSWRVMASGMSSATRWAARHAISGQPTNSGCWLAARRANRTRSCAHSCSGQRLFAVKNLHCSDVASSVWRHSQLLLSPT